MINFTAAFAPAGTPKDIVETLAQHFVSIYRDPDAQSFLDRTSWLAFPGGSQELRDFQRSEIERWGAAAKAANIPQQ
jgi:tripartite-type tricarboxylate transporter receptor subunit TctC